jgi:hypothetical protein
VPLAQVHLPIAANAQQPHRLRAGEGGGASAG